MLTYFPVTWTVVTVLGIIVTTAAGDTCGKAEWESNSRLCLFIRPLQYDLYIHPSIDKGTFAGYVHIDINVTRPCDHIRLHMKSLNMTRTELSKGGRSVALKRAFEYKQNDYWVIQPEENLTAEVYRLSMEFSGKLNKISFGFYRSQYYDPADRKFKYVVSTHTEPTDVRIIFPCFDEPSFKAKFKVTLVKPSHMTALSNMPIESEHVEGNGTTVKFRNSLPMSTYLLAFAIGEFGFEETVTKTGIPVRAFATRPHAKDTKYAASIAPKILEFYEQYFGIEYPLPKLDIIGVPDFPAGAMENWGLIVFREEQMLYNSEKGSASAKLRIAGTVAHELAHFWFGDLVTMKWWNDLWLNEGFASYIKYAGVNAVHPDWDVMSDFVSQDLTSALHKDAHISSHPIIQQVFSANQINEIFDGISYKKGCSILRMLEHFLGAENFRKGLSNYIKKFAVSNAVTQDLWDSLQAEAPSGVNVSHTMTTWTLQMGYPLLTVTGHDSGVLKVSQERFLAEPANKHLKFLESPFGYKWEVPLDVSCAANFPSQQLTWLRNTDSEVDIKSCPGSSWSNINSGATGFFRVKYETRMVKNMALDYHTHFSPSERCMLVDDIFALAYSNYTSYSEALEFGLVMKRESHSAPWDCAGHHFMKILNLLEISNSDAIDLYRKYLKEVLHAIYSKLEWTDSEDDPHLLRMLKPSIFGMACKQGNKHCRQMAKSLFMDWLQFNTTVPISLRGVVYRWGIWQTEEDMWYQTWKRYLAEEDGLEQGTLLQALAYSQEPWTLSKLMDFAKNESQIKRQNYFHVYSYMASNPVGSPIIWNYYRENMDYLIDRFGITNRYLGKTVMQVTSYFASEVQLEEMKELFAKYPDAGAGKRARESALEYVKSNIQWCKRSVGPIYEWLKTRYK